MCRYTVFYCGSTQRPKRIKHALTASPDPKQPSLQCFEAILDDFHRGLTACLPERQRKCGDADGDRPKMSFTNADAYSWFSI